RPRRAPAAAGRSHPGREGGRQRRRCCPLAPCRPGSRAAAPGAGAIASRAAQAAAGRPRCRRSSQRAAQAKAAANRATPQALQALRELNQRLLAAEARLEAASPVVHFDLDTEVRRDGAPVPRGQALTVSEPATFTLGELGTVTVRPGGESIADSARQVQALRRELQQQLALLGATSLDEAERAAAERQELLQQAASQQELLKAHAPGGVATLDAEIARLESELEQLAAAPVADGVDLAELTRQLQAARAELQATEAAAAAAASELKAAQDQQAAAQRRLVELQAQLAAQQGELRRRQSLLAEARSREPDEELASALAVADAAAKAAAEELGQARRELAAAEPERRELELSMARDAYASIKKRYAELQRSARDLQIELQSLGQTGLGERRQELQGQLEQARLQAERLEREAQ